jgi:putative ABC transport system permease protein
VLAGLIVGMVAALALRQVVSTFVFGITTADPLTYLLVASTFSGVALTAVMIPARRASRIEPITALRFE